MSIHRKEREERHQEIMSGMDKFDLILNECKDEETKKKFEEWKCEYLQLLIGNQPCPQCQTTLLPHFARGSELFIDAQCGAASATYSICLQCRLIQYVHP